MANKLRQEVMGAFTGVRFEIRRVKISDYMRELKDLPFSLAPGTTEELDKLKDSLERLTPDQLETANNKTLICFLKNGIVRMQYPDEDWIAPNIWFGEESECPSDRVLVSDLGSDADLVAGEIAQLSFNLKGVKALEGFFRGAQQQPAGPGSEEVRTETVEPAAT